MKNNWIRFLAGVIASAVLGGACALTGGRKSGKRTDGLMYQASGLHPDGELMSINGQVVSCEEYLYWLAQDCEYLASQVEGLDWNAAVTEGMTFAEYAKADAAEAVKQHAVVRAWAEKAGITLSENSQAQLTAQRQQYVTTYGGEEGYAKQLQLMGLTDEAFQNINQVYFLYSELYKAYCAQDGALRPADEEINAFAQEGGYRTILPLYWTVTGDKAADAASMEKAKAAVERLRSAGDKDAEYQAIATEMALETSAAGETHSSEELGSEITAALDGLKAGEVSDVVVTDGRYYVFVSKDLGTGAVLDKMFNDKLDTMRESAGVRYNCRSYDKLNVGTFYTKLQTLRSQLQSANSGSTEDTAPQS